MKREMYIIKELQEFIWKGYGESLPGDLDKLFNELAEIYVNSESRDRESIRCAVDDDMRLLLLGFSDRLAIMADRTEDKYILFLGLISHSIEDFRYDKRENIFRLVLINHVANKLNVSMPDLISEAILLSSSRGTEYLTSYLNRPKETNTLKAMRINEIITNEGVDYEYKR